MQALTEAEAVPAGPPPLTEARIEKIRELAKVEAETVSSDASIRVLGDILPYPDRQLLLTFIEQVRAELETLLGVRGAGEETLAAVSFRGPAYHILLQGFAGENPETPATLSLQLRPYHPDHEFISTIRISAENPARDMDAHQLAELIVEGLVRMKVLSFRQPSLRPYPPPRWFTRGLARALDRAQRQSDYDALRDRWFEAEFPPVWMLLSEEAPAADADPAIAAELVSYWLSFPQLPQRFQRLCSLLGRGTAWSSALFLHTSLFFGEHASGAPEPELSAAQRRQADAHFDYWFYTRVSRILTTGVTTPQCVKRALLLCRLLPGERGVPPTYIPETQNGTLSPLSPLSPLLLPENAAWAPGSAQLICAELMRLAAGRGDDFREACRQITEILFPLTQGKRPDKNAAEQLAAALQRLSLSATL